MSKFASSKTRLFFRVYEYHVTVYYITGDNTSCVSDFSNSVTVTIEDIGTADLQKFDGITIYPNPTTEVLSVVSYHLPVESVEIFDVFGRSLHSCTPLTSYSSPLISDYASHSSFPIDISHLPAGIYFVRVRTENGVTALRFVKQ